jgi:hypothetical protein
VSELLALIPEADRRDPVIVSKYLRAHSDDVRLAFDKYMATAKWRKDHHVDEILKAPPLPEHRLKLLQLSIPCSYHGVDKEHRPLYFAKSGDVDVDCLLHSLCDAELMQSHIWAMEYSVHRAKESSAKHGKHVSTFSTVVDMSGVGSSQKKLMNFAEMFAKLDEDHYPLTLGFCAVINTPWYLHSLYAIISPFLSATTRSRITLLGSNYTEHLRSLIHDDQLPVEYGGKCDGTCCGSKPCMPRYSLEHVKRESLAAEAPHLSQLKTTKIDSGESTTLVASGVVGSTFAWYIKPECKDIEVSAVFVPTGSQPPINVILARRVDSDYEFGLRGEYVCKVPGKLTILLDNRYSMWTSKTVRHSLLVK